MRTLVVTTLALSLMAGPAFASEPVDLQAGQAAPYTGALCDAETSEKIRARRLECEAENKRLEEALKAAPHPAPSTAGAVLVVGSLAFVAGVVLGVLMAVKVR